MKVYSSYSMKVRMLSILFAAIIILSLLLGRVFYLSVLKGDELQGKALSQWMRNLPVTAKRGDIVDVNNNIIASTSTLYNVYLRAKNVTNEERTAKVLSEILELEYTDMLAKTKKKNVSEVTIKKKVPKSAINRLIESGVDGVYFSEDIERVYPYNEVLSQVLGFTSVDNVGQSGIEAYYDKFLKGIDGKSLIEGDILGHELEEGQKHYLPAIDGLNLKLTIDINIQQIVENVLQQAMLANNPKSVGCIVMEPKSGAVRAMANLPSFDLNNPPRGDISSLMSLSRNKMVVDIYEPGSTFKVLTAAASLEECKKGNKNAFSASHIFKNNSRIRTIDGQNIKCWDSHSNGKHSNQDLAMALNNSCNPIFVDIAMALGKDVFYDYIEKFGYGKATGIDYIGEGSGMLIAESLVKNCDLARISFGQTIAVTPLQLLCATAAAINGGKYYSPYLVDEVFDSQNVMAYRHNSTALREVISKDTSATVASMLEGVVSRGSGKHAFIEGYRVGGKTGTAQKYENGHIAQGKNIMSFVGFFPANDPKYIALLVVDEPMGGGYGSTIAAPYVKMIFEQIISYTKMPMQA